MDHQIPSAPEQFEQIQVSPF